MKPCPACSHQVPDISRFCTKCGKALEDQPRTSGQDSPRGTGMEELNLTVLYVMVGILLLAIVFPPWETPPTQPPEFLGFSFALTPPTPDAQVSRLLMTVEVITIVIAGVYFAWVFRRRGDR